MRTRLPSLLRRRLCRPHRGLVRIQHRRLISPCPLQVCSVRQQHSAIPPMAVDKVLIKAAQLHPMALSLPEIVELSSESRLLEFARFLWRELPVRIAQRVVELSRLPYHLSDMESIINVRNQYIESFHILKAQAEPVSEESMRVFAHVVGGHFSKMQSAVEQIAMGVNECLSAFPAQAPQVKSCPFLNSFIDDFHSARIGTRVLTAQFNALFEQKYSDEGAAADGHLLGIIDDECKPATILRQAADDAARLCYANFFKAPAVRVYDPQSLTMTYLPSHLHYVFVEVMKNSMRAVCERYPDKDEDELPPLNAVIIGSDESHDVTVKLSDQGGGIPKADIDKIWNYSFTTVQEPPTAGTSGEHSTHSGPDIQPMSGFGYGLPLSRLHCRYYGGDLQVVSLDGYGTDAFVYMHYLTLT